MRRLFLLMLIPLLAGCALHRPQEIPLPAPVPEVYLQDDEPHPAASPERWWEAFGDPRLNGVMEEVFAGNLDLAQAAARLEQSEALLGAARAARLPVLNLEGTGGRSRQPSPFGAATGDSYRLSAAAAFEVDLWRRLASREEASRLEADAFAQDVKALYLTLSARTADLYFLAVEQRAQLDLTDRSIETFAETLERVERRYREGLVPPLDVYQSRQNLALARSRRPQFVNTLAAAEHALAVLAGRYPDRQSGGRDVLPLDPPLFPAGVPSALLAHRPDVEASLLRLKAADHRIAAAIAERFPAFSLTGNYGGASADLGDLFASGSLFWNLLLNLSQPIFDGGRRGAEVDRTRAVFRENLARYHLTVLTAFREVEDALVANRTGEERIARLRERVEASEGAHRVALDRYLQGLSDYLPVLTAQGALFDAESQLLAARRQLVADRITLARALGGRWMDEEMERYSDKGTHR